MEQNLDASKIAIAANIRVVNAPVVGGRFVTTRNFGVVGDEDVYDFAVRRIKEEGVIGIFTASVIEVINPVSEVTRRLLIMRVLERKS